MLFQLCYSKWHYVLVSKTLCLGLNFGINLRKQYLFFFFFFLWYRIFWPPMRTLPLGHPWIRGFIPYLVAVETVACFTRQSAMESSVVSSLPDRAFTPTPRKHGVERSTMKHSSETGVESPHMWVTLLIAHHQLSYLRENWTLMECGRALDEPFFGMPTRIRGLGRTS